MSQIKGLSNIRSGQRIHLSSISKKGRSKFLMLFMLDNERQLLQKDNEILKQRQLRNEERIKTINAEIFENLRQDSALVNNTQKGQSEIRKIPDKWKTTKINV
jgi:penicillin-binding protein-related factor A (putative recombinase)